MAQGFYETFVRGLRLPWIGEYLAGLASIGDRLRALAQRAVYLHLPQYAQDTDALALLASERAIEPGLGETSDQLAARLVQWIQQHQLSGTSAGLLAAIYFCRFGGAGDCVIVQQNGMAFTLAAAPDLTEVRASPPAALSWLTVVTLPNGNPAIPLSSDGKPAIVAGTIPWWTFKTGPMDGDGNQWNGRFALVFPHGLPGYADLSIAANLTKLRRLIAQFRPAHALPVYIAVVTAGDLWDWPVDTWITDTWDNPAPAVTYYTP